MKSLTKKQALKMFNEEIRPLVPRGDKPMLREAWNNFTNSLAQDGLISWERLNRWVGIIKN